MIEEKTVAVEYENSKLECRVGGSLKFSVEYSEKDSKTIECKMQIFDGYEPHPEWVFKAFSIPFFFKSASRLIAQCHDDEKSLAVFYEKLGFVAVCAADGVVNYELKASEARHFMPRTTRTRDFWLVGNNFPVQPLLDQLAANPELWVHDRDFRMVDRGGMKSPHRDSSDMWIRFNNYENSTSEDFTNEHVSQWYPEATKLPAIFQLAADVSGHVRSEQLGGIYLIKLPAGKQIHPHRDYSWHSIFYNKFVVMLNTKKGVVFGWDSGELHPESGEVWEVENDLTHWVRNDSNEDMIIATMNIRTFNRAFSEALK